MYGSINLAHWTIKCIVTVAIDLLGGPIKSMVQRESRTHQIDGSERDGARDGLLPPFHAAAKASADNNEPSSKIIRAPGEVLSQTAWMLPNP